MAEIGPNNPLEDDMDELRPEIVEFFCELRRIGALSSASVYQEEGKHLEYGAECDEKLGFSSGSTIPQHFWTHKNVAPKATKKG